MATTPIKTSKSTVKVMEEPRKPFFSSPGTFFQPKLSIGAPDDRYEKEADEVAEKVMRKPEGNSSAQRLFTLQSTPAISLISRKCSACEEEEVQKKGDDTDDNKISDKSPFFLDTDNGNGDQNIQRKANADSIFFGARNVNYPVQRKCATCEEEEKLQRKVSVNNQDAGVHELATPALQRTCNECSIDGPEPEEIDAEKDDPDNIEVKVSPKRKEGAQTPQVPENFETTLHRSKNGGSPLHAEVRRDMESRFQQDFSEVRVHTSSEAASLSSSINAQAFAHGKNIYFNHNKYNPSTDSGKKLLAHELTHVIQQTGSASLQAKIQRSDEPKLGNWAHHKIQERLRDRDNDLITEAPIPGGTRDNKEINVVGFADFYKSEDSIVAGVRGKRPDNQTGLPNPQYRYENMPTKATSTTSRFAKIDSKSPFKYGPRIKKKKWDFTPNFPSNFAVGELKPLFPTEFPSSLLYHGSGFLQTGNYKDGFEEFVSHLHGEKGAPVPASISGSYLDIPDTKIPDKINYGKFAQEHANEKPGKEAILKVDTTFHERVWMYRLKDGVYVYFLLPHPYTSDDFPAKIEKQLRALDPMLDELRKAHPKISSTISPKRNSEQGQKKDQVQRKEEDWDTPARQWEDKRKDWVKGKLPDVEKPKEFLKEKAKGVEKKAKIDKELNIKQDATTPLGKQVKNVKKVRFWSSFKGRMLGALRFRFGKVFNKLETLFENIKTKVRGRQLSADKLKSRNGIFAGWKKVATARIIGFAVEILKKMVAQAFSGFVGCINGIITSISGKYVSATEEAKQELIDEVQPLCCEIMVFKTKMDEAYTKYDKHIATFTETVETIKKWREILDDVEIAVRVGVQVASCGLPPGIGCLWGLVAQFGISTGLSLLMRTSYFDDEIAKPAASALMDAFVGDKLHNLMIDVLEETPLSAYMKRVIECKRKNKVIEYGKIGAQINTLDPNDPAVAKARQEWEKENKGDIMKDLNNAFSGKGGKTLSENDFQQLMDEITKSGKDAEAIKSLLENARDAKSGKLNLADSIAYVKGDKVPGNKKPKERDIDYDKAARSNEAYEKILGWDTSTFYKKPGVKSNSKEFADAVFDMQEAIGVNPDGIAGPESTIKFYDKNKLKHDAIYRGAVKVKLTEEEKKKTEEALKEPYPSYGELAADLKAATSWRRLSNGDTDFIKMNGHYLIIIKTDNGARVGAFFKYIEIEYKGEKRLKTIDTSDFLNIDVIKKPSDGFIAPLLVIEKPGGDPVYDIGLVRFFVENDYAELTHLDFRSHFVNIIIG